MLVTHRLPSESSAMPVAVAAVANVAMAPGAAVTAAAIATSDPGRVRPGTRSVGSLRGTSCRCDAPKERDPRASQVRVIRGVNVSVDGP